MGKIKFGIVGGGWRAEFFLRIARELPTRFEVTGMLIRDPDKGKVIEQSWGVATYRTMEQFVVNCKMSFAVVSVPWAICPQMIEELAERGVPVLSETPPAPDLEGLVAINRLTEQGAKIQVAEQYIFRPHHMARLELIASGKLGTVSQAQVSVAHAYHGVSLIRHFLGITYENCTISAMRFDSPIIEGPGRSGPPTAEKTKSSSQIIAWMQFGDKLGVFDFCGDQYYSWIRSPRVLIRGDRGEIHNDQVRYLQNYSTPIQHGLKRRDAGMEDNLEGYCLQGIMAGDEWLYRNEFQPGRLSDDEIAVATCLQKMEEYVRGSPSFYSLAEASQDHYLGLMIKEAYESGKTVQTSMQPWANI